MWGIQQQGKISKATRTCGSQNFSFSDVAFPFSCLVKHPHSFQFPNIFSFSIQFSARTLHQYDRNDDPPPRRDSTASDVHGDRETRERLGVGTDRVIAGAGETQRMSQFKDPTMKLFGMTISLPPTLETCVHEIREGGDRSDQNLGSSNASSREENFAGEGARREGDQVTLGGGEPIEDIQEDSSSHQTVENPNDQTTSSGISENPKTPMVDRETSSLKPSSKGEDGETVSQDKTLKKPDKILPCPRCNSMDTKFCYYNNYNVNQPRHFCKNCQRYWTAGGTMRNVPVGAGRRKNKNSSGSHFSHIIVPEALQTPRANGVPNSALGKNGTVLNFATDSPLCESMASVLKLAEKTQNHVRNGLHRPEQRDTGDDRSSGSSITASNSIEKEGLQDSAFKNYPGFPPQVQCFQGNWPVEWNSAQWSSVMPPQVLCASGFPLSFYPSPAYWGCAVPGSWNIQSPPPPSSVPRHGQSSAPNSATLGKHSRDGSILNPANPQKEDAVREQSSERCLWVPKTLRIDDSSDAERNSIWATLGLKNEKTNPANGGRLFKAFQSRNDNKSYGVETCPVLQANPAALSRSLNFHESS